MRREGDSESVTELERESERDREGERVGEIVRERIKERFHSYNTVSSLLTTSAVHSCCSLRDSLYRLDSCTLCIMKIERKGRDHQMVRKIRVTGG